MGEDRAERRLAAIVAADVVGYSRLLARDERATLAALKAHRDELWLPEARARGGRLFATAGDSVLIELQSAVAALEWALAVQGEMVKRNAGIADDRALRLRIGINIGEVIADGDDIFGDGINIAARIEALADPGGIALADDAYRQIIGRLDVKFVDGGEQVLKNITRAVKIWHWHEGMQPVEDAPPAADGDSSIMTLIARIEPPTVAVLPFVNRSANEELEFFCDGLTESLTTDLSRVLRIAVAPGADSFALKGRGLGAREAAAELGVRYLIEGSVQAIGNRLRINTQLTDSVSGELPWAERFDRLADDLFATQDEICDAIALAVDVALASGEAARSRFSGTESADARHHVLRAWCLLSRYTPVDFDRAMGEADRARAIDPDYAEAHARAASSRIGRVLYAPTRNDETLLDEAIDLARRTLALSPTAGEGHSVIGLAYLARRNFEQSLEACRRGVEISPANATLHSVFARPLIATGRFDEAYRETIEALRLQPNAFPMILLLLGLACLSSGRIEIAVAALERFRTLAAHLSQGHALLAAAYAANDEAARARALVDDILAVDPAITVRQILGPYPFEDLADDERLATLLRQCGLPDGDSVMVAPDPTPKRRMP